LLTSDQTSDLERLRSCQREKTELELRATALLGELEELRAEKEKLRLDIEQEERTHKRQLADQIAESKLYHSEKESLKSKSVRKQDELQQENTKLKRELDRTVSRLEENGHKFK
jgi:predicted  nucleic acid-binding Zn-ribbon protein